MTLLAVLHFENLGENYLHFLDQCPYHCCLHWTTVPMGMFPAGTQNFKIYSMT